MQSQQLGQQNRAKNEGIFSLLEMPRGSGCESLLWLIFHGDAAQGGLQHCSQRTAPPQHFTAPGRIPSAGMVGNDGIGDPGD